jgi:hypothetical protein
VLFSLAGAKQINGSVYRRPPKVAFGFFHVRAQGIAPQHAQEDRLQDIFRIRGITGNPVRRPEHQAVVFLKNAAEFRSLRKNRNLSGCELQGSLLSSDSPQTVRKVPDSLLCVCQH